MLVVGHALAIRYVVDAADGLVPAARMAPVDHALPYRLDRDDVERAATLLEAWSDAPVVPGSLERRMSGVRARPTSTLMGLRLCGALLSSVCAARRRRLRRRRLGDSSSAVSGEPISFEQLAQSASTSAEAKSGRFAFDLSMTLPGADEPFALSGEGAFDQASGRVVLRRGHVVVRQAARRIRGRSRRTDAKDVPDFDDPAGWKIEVVQDGDVGYVRFPALDDQLPEGKSWIRADGTDASARAAVRPRGARAVRHDRPA